MSRSQSATANPAQLGTKRSIRSGDDELVKAKMSPIEGLALIFDTETTGFPRRGGFRAPGQPYIVQLAYILSEVGGEVRAKSSVMIQPDGWEVPERAEAVHGISTGMAKRCGIPLKVAMSGFYHHVMQADILVAHNIKFDLQLLQAALFRIGNESLAEKLADIRQFCTQESSVNVLQLPPTEKMMAAGRDHFKSPRLGEAYKHLCGEELKGAHDALVDAEACRRVFEELRNRSNSGL